MKTKEQICAALAQDLIDFLELMCAPRDEPAPSPRLYTYSDLAAIFEKSKSTIRQWVCAGEFGEPVKVGSSTRVTQEGLEKYLADHSGPTEKRQTKRRTRGTRAAEKVNDLSSMRI